MQREMLPYHVESTKYGCKYYYFMTITNVFHKNKQALFSGWLNQLLLLHQLTKWAKENSLKSFCTSISEALEAPRSDPENFDYEMAIRKPLFEEKVFWIWLWTDFMMKSGQETLDLRDFRVEEHQMKMKAMSFRRTYIDYEAIAAN